MSVAVLILLAGVSTCTTDSLGREFNLPVPPERIVSLAPSLTEILFAVGVGDRVVGVTSYCDHPEAAQKIAKVGGFTNPSPEAVVGLKPDLVIATADTSTRKRFDAIEAAGQKIYVVHPKDFDSTMQTVRCLGTLVGKEREAARVADEMAKKRKAVIERVAEKRKPRTLLLLQAEPIIAAGPGTFLDEVIVLAGGENIAADAPLAWPRLSRESIALSDPEVILTTFPGGEKGVRKLLAGTSAVKNGRVHELDRSVIERPGPRIVEGLEAVAALLHP